MAERHIWEKYDCISNTATTWTTSTTAITSAYIGGSDKPILGFNTITTINGSMYVTSSNGNANYTLIDADSDDESEMVRIKSGSSKVYVALKNGSSAWKTNANGYYDLSEASYMFYFPGTTHSFTLVNGRIKFWDSDPVYQCTKSTSTTYSQGSTKLDTVYNASDSAYPTNGRHTDGYWYVYTGSEKVHGIYVGVGGVAKKVKKLYVGVDGKARKIKKGYIGVGGVARPVLTGGELAYYGTTTNLEYARNQPSAATVGDYALFAGGNTNASSTTFALDTIDAYNKLLVKSIPSNMSLKRYTMGTATVGNYALFAGGTASTGTSTVVTAVDAYDTNLTKSSAPNLDLGLKNITKSGTTVGDYALFAGGWPHDTDTYSVKTDIVHAYSKTLTKTKATNLSSKRWDVVAATVGDYALFAGGDPNGVSVDTVDVYNSSLTRISTLNLSVARVGAVRVTIGNYALFAGGHATSITGLINSTVCTVDVYDTSLTRTVIAPLTSSGDGVLYSSGTALGDFALIGGGRINVDWSDYTARSTVDIYDSNLTKQSEMNLSAGFYCQDAATVGNYALFAGGRESGQGYTATNIVNAFMI